MPRWTALAGLARLLFGRRWRKRLIVTLGAYIDASQSQNPCDVTVAVACAATAEHWDTFCREWHALAVKPFGVGYFHTTEYVYSLNSKEGPYWKRLKTRSRRVTFERGLNRIIRDNGIITFAEAIPERDHRAMLPLLRPFGRIEGDSYYFCLWSCLARLQLARDRSRQRTCRVNAFVENSTDENRDERIKRRYD